MGKLKDVNKKIEETARTYGSKILTFNVVFLALIRVILQFIHKLNVKTS